jgi:hypothetical protein
MPDRSYSQGWHWAGVLLYTLAQHELVGRAPLSVSRHVLALFRLDGFGAIRQKRWVIAYPSLFSARIVLGPDGHVFM